MMRREGRRGSRGGQVDAVDTERSAVRSNSIFEVSACRALQELLIQRRMARYIISASWAGKTEQDLVFSRTYRISRSLL